MAASSLEIYVARILPLLDDGPKTIEELGVSQGVINVLRRNGLVRPKMRPWFNKAGKVIGAIEMWQRSTPPAPKPARLDCALMDFAAMGLL
jgi:hypothetical protein